MKWSKLGCTGLYTCIKLKFTELVNLGCIGVVYKLSDIQILDKTIVTMASTISSLIGEVMITSSDGDYLREVTSRW